MRFDDEVGLPLLNMVGYQLKSSSALGQDRWDWMPVWNKLHKSP